MGWWAGSSGWHWPAQGSEEIPGQVLHVGTDQLRALQEIPGQWRWDGRRWAPRSLPAQSRGDALPWALGRAPCPGLVLPCSCRIQKGELQCWSLVGAFSPRCSSCSHPVLGSRSVWDRDRDSRMCLPDGDHCRPRHGPENQRAPLT